MCQFIPPAKASGISCHGKLNNWDSLPKSKFDDVTVVIFKEIKNEDWGYGHDVPPYSGELDDIKEWYPSNYNKLDLGSVLWKDLEQSDKYTI